MHALLIEDDQNDAYLIERTLRKRTAMDIQLEWVDRLESGLMRL